MPVDQCVFAQRVVEIHRKAGREHHIEPMLTRSIEDPKDLGSLALYLQVAAGNGEICERCSGSTAEQAGCGKAKASS